jgi:hypothetical protein
VDAVVAMEPRMEDASEYRRREVRSVKKVFQSRDLDCAEFGGAPETGADVEEWRQSEGVKKEEGVVVEGFVQLDIDGLDGDVWRAPDETCRFGGKV